MAALGVLGAVRGGGGDGAARHLETMETFRRSLPHSHAPPSASAAAGGGGEKQPGGEETTGHLRCAEG
jgi:hypothetical protein